MSEAKIPDDLKELYEMVDDWHKNGLSIERMSQVLRELGGPTHIRPLIERIAALEQTVAALTKERDQLQAALERMSALIVGRKEAK